MTSNPNSDVTLLTEHLNYRPAALIDDIVNSVNVLAYKACDAVERGLLSVDPSDLGFKLPPTTSKSTTKLTPEEEAAVAQSLSETAKHEIETGVHQLETLLETKIDKNFDKLEIVALRSIISVPAEIRDWVRLSHYEGLDLAAAYTSNEGFGNTNAADVPTTESVTLQRRKLRETQKLHAWLRAESARNEATIRSLKAILLLKNNHSQASKAPKQEANEKGGEEAQGKEEIYPSLAFLQNREGLITGGNTSHPLATGSSFTMSQLPALKTLLQNLAPRLDSLANDNDGDASTGGRGGSSSNMVGEEEKSWRRERLQFVEKETRRYLEHVRTLELDDMGEVRDGEWQGRGRKVAMGEVEGLERVVKLVSGESQHSGENGGGPVEERMDIDS